MRSPGAGSSIPSIRQRAVNLGFCVDLLHERSPAERDLIRSTTGLEPDTLPAQVQNPLKGQSAAILSEWVCDELDRLAKAIA